MSSFKTKQFRPGSFVTSWYSRGGQIKDKYGNKSSRSLTFRNVHSGLVVSNEGKILGVERNRHHSFGNDPRRIRVGAGQTAQQRKIMLELRKSGRVH